MGRHVTLFRRTLLTAVHLVELAPLGDRRYLLVAQRQRGADPDAANQAAQALTDQLASLTHGNEQDMCLVLPPGVAFTFDRLAEP